MMWDFAEQYGRVDSSYDDFDQGFDLTISTELRKWL
jgi:hypothetical protein